MTQMMRHQIDGIHERGEPLAALLATESPITVGSDTASAPCTSSGPSTSLTTPTPVAMRAQAA